MRKVIYFTAGVIVGFGAVTHMIGRALHSGSMTIVNNRNGEVLGKTPTITSGLDREIGEIFDSLGKLRSSVDFSA